MKALPALLLMGLQLLSCKAENLDPSVDLDSLGNNTLFTKWRPTYHFLAPNSWMNDPSAPMYDPTTGTYHLFYQWHPRHVNWGNISWGHATSADLVTWEDVYSDRYSSLGQALGTGPPGSYDHLGIFSGTGQPVNLRGEEDGTLFLFYTSVQHLPTGWRIPYIANTETQSLATSADGGKTWVKYAGNPVIDGPPEGWNVTGWRDPMVHAMPELDAVLGQTEPHYYTIFGSGIKGVGPRLPLYSAPARNLTDWTFLGALFEVGENFTWGGDADITASMGFNFEVAGFFSLTEKEKYGGDGKTVHYYANFGTEGGNTTKHYNGHWSMWAEGTMSRRANGSAAMDFRSVGVGDWGNLYAIMMFNDTKNDRRVLWGWAEEDMNGYGIRAQGWQGVMNVPREVFVHVTKGVDADGGKLLAKQGWYVEEEMEDGEYSFTVYTLGVKPLDDVLAGLREGSSCLGFANQTVRGNQASPRMVTLAGPEGNLNSPSFMLETTIRNATGKVGVLIRASPGMEEYTAITWDPVTYEVEVNREHSSLIPQFLNASLWGHFYPFTSAATGKAEPVRLQVFGDGSMVEIYINDRFALSARIYPTRDDSGQMALWAAGGAEAAFGGTKVWWNLRNAWPGRKANSSEPLVFDDATVTNNYTWWPGF